MPAASTLSQYDQYHHDASFGGIKGLLACGGEKSNLLDYVKPLLPVGLSSTLLLFCDYKLYTIMQ